MVALGQISSGSGPGAAGFFAAAAAWMALLPAAEMLKRSSTASKDSLQAQVQQQLEQQSLQTRSEHARAEQLRADQTRQDERKAQRSQREADENRAAALLQSSPVTAADDEYDAEDSAVDTVDRGRRPSLSEQAESLERAAALQLSEDDRASAREADLALAQALASRAVDAIESQLSPGAVAAVETGKSDEQSSGTESAGGRRRTKRRAGQTGSAVASGDDAASDAGISAALELETPSVELKKATAVPGEPDGPRSPLYRPSGPISLGGGGYRPRTDLALAPGAYVSATPPPASASTGPARPGSLAVAPTSVAPASGGVHGLGGEAAGVQPATPAGRFTYQPSLISSRLTSTPAPPPPPVKAPLDAKSEAEKTA